MTRAALRALGCIAALQPTIALGQGDPERVPLREAVQVTPATETCLTVDALSGVLSRWLQVDHLSPDIRITLRVGSGPGERTGFVMERQGKVSERFFDVLPGDCSARQDAVGLVMALAIDHTVFERAQASGSTAPTDLGRVTAPGSPDASPADGDGAQGPNETGVEKPPPPIPAQEVAAETVSAVPQTPKTDAPSADTAPRSTLGAHAIVGVGVVASILPGVVPVVYAGAGLVLDRRATLRLTAHGTAIDETALGGGRVQRRWIAGLLEGCLGGDWIGLRWDGCAGYAAGVVTAFGEGFPENREVTAPWMGATLGAGIGMAIGSHLQLGLRLAVVGTLLRPRLHTADPAGGRLESSELPTLGITAGLEARFGAF